jgi:hypothetical protein
MPSRADSRILLEYAARSAVIVLLAFLLWQSVRRPREAPERNVESRMLAGVLPEWTRLATAPHRIDIRLDSVPSPLERDWLRALAATGSIVSWSGNLPGVMVALQPVASPGGGIRARVAAPDGSTVVMGDDVGAVDTVRAENAGAQLVLPSRTGRLDVRVDGSRASTVQRDSVRPGKVLVIGNAGWETKFVVAALEEEGWKLDAFIRVAPLVEVTQGSIASIDTSRYSAVVALDDAVSPYANRIVEFARSGGGVVLSPAAASLESLSPLRSGSVNRVTSETVAIQASGAVSLANLPLAPISALRNDAVPLEKRGSSVAVAARRFVAGRALQLGYEDTWRWRMGGGANGMGDHRAWWTTLVSSVAYAPRIPIAPKIVTTDEADDAPVADLVAAIGPAGAQAGGANIGRNPADLTAWLFTVLSLLLLGEVASRRLRGTR